MSQNISPNIPVITKQQGSTSMQGQGIQDTVENSYIANRAKASGDANPLTTLALTAGIGYGLGQAMDRFNPMCGGEYNKSILGKLGNWGDNFAKNNAVGKFIEKGLQRINVGFYNLSKKSKVLNSLRVHQTRPEWQLAKGPGQGLKGFLGMDWQQICEEYLKPISNREGKIGFIKTGKSNAYQKLEQYGLKEAEIAKIEKEILSKHSTFEAQALALQKKELELLKAPKAEVTKAAKKGLEGLQKLAQDLKAKKLGFKDLADFHANQKIFMDNPKAVLKHLEKADKNLTISIWRGNGKLGKLRGHLFGRRVTTAEYLNKYKTMLGKGSSSKIGRFIQKSFAWIMEGGTCRFAGGKLAALFQATILADMLYHVYKAPWKEKFQTFAERSVNDLTYFMALTAGMIGMHKVGGLKYMGLKNAKDVEKYRSELAKFNANVKNGVFGSKKEYNEALKILKKDHLGTKNLNFLQKGIQKIGAFINMGNERALSYVSKEKWNLNWLRKCANGNILGVPMRVAIPLFMISPFLAKLTTKCVHAIVGKPTNSVLDEDKEDEPEMTEEQIAQQMAQQQPQPSNQNAAQTPQYRNPADFQSDSNLIKQAYVEQNQAPQTTDVNTQTPNPNQPVNNDPNKELEPERHYIPSPIGMVQQSPDTSAADKALADADRAEKQIQELMSGNKLA